MKLKKFVSVIIAAALTFNISILASAELSDEITTESTNTNDENFVLVFEEQYVDENNSTIIDRIYVEDGIMPLSTSGTKTIKATKNIDDVYEMWVKGTFSWNSEKDTATVKDTSYGYEQLDSSVTNKISNQNFSSGDNQGSEDIFGFGH